jgi:hypothetical protein
MKKKGKILTPKQFRQLLRETGAPQGIIFFKF